MSMLIVLSITVLLLLHFWKWNFRSEWFSDKVHFSLSCLTAGVLFMVKCQQSVVSVSTELGLLLFKMRAEWSETPSSDPESWHDRKVGRSGSKELGKKKSGDRSKPQWRSHRHITVLWLEDHSLSLKHNRKELLWSNQRNRSNHDGGIFVPHRWQTEDKSIIDEDGLLQSEALSCDHQLCEPGSDRRGAESEGRSQSVFIFWNVGA